MDDVLEQAPSAFLHGSSHFPGYFEGEAKDLAIAQGIHGLRTNLVELRETGFSASVVHQTFRVVLNNFWEARAVRFRAKHWMRPWSLAASEIWPHPESVPTGLPLRYEHSIPVALVAQALLDPECASFPVFYRTLRTLSVPCIITTKEDESLTSRKLDGKSLRDNMPPPFRNLRMLDWGPEALDARYEAAEIHFPEGGRPSDVAKRLLASDAEA